MGVVRNITEHKEIKMKDVVDVLMKIIVGIPILFLLVIGWVIHGVLKGISVWAYNMNNRSALKGEWDWNPKGKITK